MASEVKRGKSKLRGTGQETKTPTSSISITPPPPEIPPEVRENLTTAMQELLLRTHELSFEYSTLDCEEIQKCPLATKARELFKTVKQMHELMRKITSARTAGVV